MRLLFKECVANNSIGFWFSIAMIFGIGFAAVENPVMCWFLIMPLAILTVIVKASFDGARD